MTFPITWRVGLLALVLVVASGLLIIWWRQQTRRWFMVIGLCAAAAAGLSWWSGIAFRVADYRAGCDGLCYGHRGAPIPFYRSGGGGESLSPLGLAANTLVYFLILLAWVALVRSVARSGEDASGARFWLRGGFALFLLVAPFALAPLFLPPPEATVRGDSLRVAINARREVYLYDQLASWPVVRVGLEDVRPRPDGQPGMRVCLRTYTFFFAPTGFMTLDMTPEGVHSNQGDTRLPGGSCWN